MKAILVCVDYADLLSITLPYNRHHFEDVMIVTTPEDARTQALASRNDCQCFLTQAFYQDGAIFNKWRALESGLDILGREGWLCIMDADILWPRSLPWDCKNHLLNPDCLYTPHRRMKFDVTTPLPPESEWCKFQLHPQEVEFAGYTQIFHARAPYLGAAPWHETNWRHCGGADSFFQMKWPESRKIRPGFEVLHLGPACQNWCGRATRYVDGTMPPDAQARRQQLRKFLLSRKPGPTRFDAEKIL